MATTSQQVFELTMSVIDELSSTGAADTADTSEYKNRTLGILNVLQGELYPFSDAYEVGDPGKRPIARIITSFADDIVSLDDYICRSVLPYGLAAHLLMDENPNIAATCLQRYEELRAGLSRGLLATSEDITDLYGGIEHGQYSYW